MLGLITGMMMKNAHSSSIYMCSQDNRLFTSRKERTKALSKKIRVNID